MSVIHVTEATVGAPNSGRMSGTNGDLYAMLKYALPLNGWAVEYDDAANFAAVFRPGSGNRFRLHINDNSATSSDARLAVIRGCENASAAATLIDPFPTVANVANNSSNWLKSQTANTTARAFDLYVGTTWVVFLCNVGGTSTTWEWGFFGDASPVLSGDSYNTVCMVRNSSNAVASQGQNITTNNGAGLATLHWARSYDGTIKDTFGAVPWYTSTFGLVSTFPVMLAGPSGKIDRERVPIIDTGTSSVTPSTSKGLVKRGWFPNIWSALHGASSGVVTSRSTFTDTSYNGSATFNVVFNNGVMIVEETDTWSAPSG